MNIQEYQLEIEKQLQNHDSAMRLLSKHYRADDRGNLRVHLAKLDFIINDLSVHFQIKTLYKLHYMEYGVTFDEDISKYYSSWERVMIPEDINARPRYNCEAIRFDGENIIYYIESIKLGVDANYLPIKEDVKEIHPISFNVKTMKFDATDEEVDAILEKWDMLRHRKDGYIDFNLDLVEYNLLLHFLTTNSVDEDVERKMIDGLQSGATSSIDSCMRLAVLYVREYIEKK